MLEFSHVDRLRAGAMMVRYSTLDDERTKLEKCLKELSRRRGVRRDDLIDLLQGDLRELQRRWGIDLSNGVDFARVKVADILYAYIENLYPNRRNRPVHDKKEVDCYRITVQIAFNIHPKLSPIRRMNLQERREWQKTYGGPFSVPQRTSQRILDEAVKQIAERMLSGGRMPEADDHTAIELPEDASSGFQANPGVDTAAFLTRRPWRSFSFESLRDNILVLSGEVEPALEAARNACHEQNRQFYTSDTLLALLGMPNGHVRDCFDLNGAADWSRQVRQKIVTISVPEGHRFVEFKWIERKEFRRALQYSMSDDSPVVNEFHLLLAIFDSASETNVDLQRLLQHDYAKVRAAAERGRGDGRGSRTPMWQ